MFRADTSEDACHEKFARRLLKHIFCII